MTDKIDILNKAIEAVSVMYPIEYSEPINSISSDQNIALAKVYADKELREYIQNQVNLNIKQTALAGNDAVASIIGKTRILTFQEMLAKGKRAYDNLEKLRKSSINN
jgi:translation initiation factor 6 (eIF-6)